MNIAALEVEPHFTEQMAAKGFTADQVLTALTKPTKITKVRHYEGQVRYCGAGVAVIIEDNARLVTIYADEVRTPLREDQKTDKRALASRRAL
jgi:hypothetical protein